MTTLIRANGGKTKRRPVLDWQKQLLGTRCLAARACWFDVDSTRLRDIHRPLYVPSSGETVFRANLRSVSLEPLVYIFPCSDYLPSFSKLAVIEMGKLEKITSIISFAENVRSRKNWIGEIMACIKIYCRRSINTEGLVLVLKKSLPQEYIFYMPTKF